MDAVDEIPSAMPRHQKLQMRLTDAIIDLCRREAFYIEELRIEGTVCVVSDRSSVLVAQITEQIGNHGNLEVFASEHLPYLNKDQVSNSTQHEKEGNDIQKSGKDDQNELFQSKRTPTSLNKRGGRYKCPFCNKSYTFKHSLKDHLNLHTGHKPHVCKLCLASFAQLGRMCMHMRREHRDQLSGTRVCCSCHTQPDITTSSHPPSIWGPDSPPTAGRLQFNNNNNNKPTADTSVNIRPSADTGVSIRSPPDGRPMDIDQIPFVQGTLNNLKQELDDSTTTETVAEITEKDSDSVLEVRNFLQQFESGKDEGNHGDPMQQGSTRGREESTLVGRGIGAGGELAQALGLVTSEQHMTPRAENTMNLTPSSGSHTAVPQCFPNATLEMLAHMAQMPHVPPQPFPIISELTQVLSAQKQQQQQNVAAAAPLFRMPPSHSLQRSPDGKFQCPLCVKTYNFKHTLKDHINKHLGHRPHVCKHCGDAFTHLASLCAHIKRRHDNQMTSDYQCELCQEKFMNLQSLKQHFTWRHKDVKFSPQQFLESARGVVQEGAAACVDPPPSLTQVYQAGVNPGLSLVTPTDTTSTTVTDTLTDTTQNKLTSITHQTASTTTTSSSLTTSPGVILPHSQAPMVSPLPSVHLPGTRLSDQCLYSPERVKQLIQKASLDDSGVTANSAPSSNNQPQFPGAFIYPGCHDNRQLESAAALPHLTPTSPAEEESVSLTTHIADYFSEVNLQTEQGLYKYKCKVCGNLFKIRNSLYEHLNSHLGRKPYVCSTCGDSFTHHSSLHNHSRNKHSLQTRQEREALYRHSCPGCHKKFRFPSELDRHFKTNPDHDIRQTPNSMV